MFVAFVAEASLKNFYMRFQWWPTVLLEWNSNLATRCSDIEKRFFEIYYFGNLHIFTLTFLLAAHEKKTILTQITHPS